VAHIVAAGSITAAISAFTVTQGPGEEGGRHQLLIGEKIEQGSINRLRERVLPPAR